MATGNFSISITFFFIFLSQWQAADSVRRTSVALDDDMSNEGEESWWQDDLSSVKSAVEAFPRFRDCEKIGVVMEGDANRPDMRHEALMWVNFLRSQGYCLAYFFDWVQHAETAWKNGDLMMNLGLTWVDAIKAVKQSNDGQVVQLINSTKSNWLEFTNGLEHFCKNPTLCKAKRVVTAFEDHGEYRMLGLPQHQKLLREDFLSGLRSLYRLTPEVKLLSYVGACKSGSMFGGPQYSAKELLQAHYFDYELLHGEAAKGQMHSMTAVIAGHSIVGRRQRALLRATEAVMEAQAMCDIASGDEAGAMYLLTSPLQDKPSGTFQNKADEHFKTLKILTESRVAWTHVAKILRFPEKWIENLEVDPNPRSRSAALNATLAAATKAADLPLSASEPEVERTFCSLLTVALELEAKDYIETPAWGRAEESEGDLVSSKCDAKIVKLAMESIRKIQPDFSLHQLRDQDDLRDGKFMRAFNEKLLNTWLELRHLVDAWKHDTKNVDGKSGWALWMEAQNSSMTWGQKCGSLKDCMEPFGRNQRFASLHSLELGCSMSAAGLKQRLRGHLVARDGAGGEGIEENGVLSGSITGELLGNLLRALAYSDDDDLQGWDDNLLKHRGTLEATGDFTYENDAMLGAASHESEPLDLMSQLDGGATRPESVLAFSASIPQIISSSLLPFTAGAIADLQERVELPSGSRFKDHVTTVEDLAIDKDSLDVDMGFGLTGTFLKLMMWAKGIEDASISITRMDAKHKAELYVELSKSGWWRQAKLNKAKFFAAIAAGKLPEGYLNLTYTSPASGRQITRFFDTMLNSENFGSPIAFGNMMETDVKEFFHSVPKKDAWTKITAAAVATAAKARRAAKNVWDWIMGLAAPQPILGDEAQLCCCKRGRRRAGKPGKLHCKVLRGEELVASRNPTKWGRPVCPASEGYHRWLRFVEATGINFPEECKGQGLGGEGRM
eukprot:TRINITY_DN9870_c0_g1_i1.p1 TRINITY_DN9870_c0_g1~~TRINITY_DN9870_c0_g1_i1.p1  ORF type:complete len:955 (+),score=203.15 TRINITY_DN9870_c0_g1_i1:70-2934(+)